MAQHDYSIANGSGAAVRSDLNNALSAIVSQNSGTTEPTTTYAYMRWADTTAGVMKMRNGANNAWITLYQLDGEWSTIAFENGSASAPSIYFKDSGTDTGIYSPGTDQVAISTNGSGRLFVDSSGRALVGTSSSTGDYLLEVQGRVGTSAGGAEVRLSRGETATQIGGNGSMLGRIWFTSGSDNGQGAQISAHADATWSSNDYPTRLIFATTADSASSPTERMRIDSSGRVGIGTTSPVELLTVGNTSTTNGIQILAGTANTSRLWFGDATTGGGRYAGFIEYDHTNNSLNIGANESTRATIDSSGRLLVGTSSARTNTFRSASNFTAPVQIDSATNSYSNGLNILNYSGSGFASIVTLGLSKTNTQGTNTIVGSADELGFVNFVGNDGTNFITAAMIGAYVDGTPGTNDMPGSLVFSTTADSASSPTEAMRINNGQAVLIGRTSSAGGISNSCKLQVATTGADWVSQFDNQNSTGANCFGLTINYSSASPNGTGNSFVNCADSTQQRAQIRSNGGLANFQANNVNLSDINTKKDISPAADTWNCIKEWEIVNYRYKDQPDDADLNLGVIAQQVAESCPEVITIFQEAKKATETEPAKEERLGVKEQQMYWMAIKALQEAQVRIETLEARLTAAGIE